MEKEPLQKDKAKHIGRERKESMAGKFADSDNHAPNFSEELSDGGERNRMAEEQLKRITTD